jgi:hypothetical protein
MHMRCEVGGERWEVGGRKGERGETLETIIAGISRTCTIERVS